MSEKDNLENMSKNEIDPKLRFDALMAGVPDGGLRSVSSISLIVCYIIANINGRVTADNIVQTMDEGMFANHFEVANAISKLKKSGVINEAEDGALTLVNPSKANIELIEMDLPLTIREKSASFVLIALGCSLAPFVGSAKSGFDLMVQIGAGTGAIFLLRWFWMRINAWTEIVGMVVSFLAAVFFQIIWPKISPDPLLFWEKLLWTIAVTTVCWLATTLFTKPEKPEVIANFKSLVRADGRDVGRGLLKAFFASMAIFAIMWGIGKLITL